MAVAAQTRLETHLDWALFYASIGIPVLPLWWPVYEHDRWICACPAGDVCSNRPGKHPLGTLVRNGVKDASLDPAVITRWWAEYPEANIGGRTGAASQLIVADIDPRNNGDKTWNEILKVNNGGKPYNTPIAETGGGGEHNVLGYREDVPNYKLAGVDIQSDNRYVVLGPSLHISGRRYQWQGNSLERLSQRILLPFPDLKIPGQEQEPKEPAYKQRRKKIKPGDDYWTLMYSYGRHSVSVVNDFDEAVRLLIAYSNIISEVGYEDLSDQDLIHIDKIARLMVGEWKTAYDQKHEAKTKATAYNIGDNKDVLNDTIPPRPPDLIQHIVPADMKHGELLGHRGEGKTMIGLLLATQAAAGRPVFDTFQVARPLRIMFVEDDTPAAVMDRRQAAMITYMKLSADEMLWVDQNYLKVYEQSFSFDDAGVARLRATLQDQKDADLPVDVVFIDSRTTSWPGSPDDPELANEIYSQKIKPLAREFDTRFMVISHPPKTKEDHLGRPVVMTVAGSAVHERDADLIIGISQVAKHPPTMRLEWLKMRDGVGEEIRQFKAVIEPAPLTVMSDDADTMEVWTPRGWVALESTTKGAKTEKRTTMEVAAEQVLYALKDSDLQETQLIKFVFDTVNLGETSAKRGVRYARDNEWIAKGDEKRSPYTLTDAGRKQLLVFLKMADNKGHEGTQ